MDADDENRKNCTDASDVGASRKRAWSESTRKEYTRMRCVGEDDGVRCIKWGSETIGGHLCGKHGGTRRCIAKDCTNVAETGPFCPEHRGACKVEGCFNVKNYQNGYCNRHGDLARAERAADKAAEKAAKEREEAYEWVQRRKRKAGLREKYFDLILTEQGGQCAKSVMTCHHVGNGWARHRCKWGDDQLYRLAADLDHIVPLADGGADDKDNLQVLCKCCHGIKTACEVDTRKIRRIREEAVERKKAYAALAL